MAKQTKAEKEADAKIDRIYNLHCSGIQISVLDIPKIFRIGHEAIAAGADDETLKNKIVEYVNSIRKN